MKKIFLATLMLVTTVAALAYPHPRPVPHPRPYPHPQPYPRYPYPRPVPVPHPAPYPQPAWCQVAAVDQYNRVIAYFNGNAPMCRDALAFCNGQVRRQGWWGARCVVLSHRW